MAVLVNELSSNKANSDARVARVDQKLEVIVIPVSDVDRAKEFYGRLGWRLDADVAIDDNFRLVQFTPPGSPCSVQFGTNLTLATPGSAQALLLIVLTSTLLAISRPRMASTQTSSTVQQEPLVVSGQRGGPAVRVPREHLSYGSFISFSDPACNGWIVQEVTTRLPGCIDSATTSFTSS